MYKTKTYILTLSCEDKAGIVAKVSGFIFEIGGFILETAQFGDEHTGKFFLRTEFQCSSLKEAIEEKFQIVADEYNISFEINDKSYSPKILIAVTKESHCLLHLLHKKMIDALDVEVVGVVSNHNDLRDITEKFDVPYHYFPVEDKQKQEEQVYDLFQKNDCDLMVLARYMQILSDSFCKKLQDKAINIHHSFLPSFKGAKPYHQAYERGVKIIGATAHYVTSDLDEGPIISQEIIHVNHAQKPHDLKILGQDIETRVLYNAVKWHSEHRVLRNGNKTVIFN